MKRRMRRKGWFVAVGPKRRLEPGEGRGKLLRLARVVAEVFGFERAVVLARLRVASPGYGSEEVARLRWVFVAAGDKLGVRRGALARFCRRSPAWVNGVLRGKMDEEKAGWQLAAVLRRLDGVEVGAGGAAGLSEREAAYRAWRESEGLGMKNERKVAA